MNCCSIPLDEERGEPAITTERAARLESLKAMFPDLIVFVADRPDGTGFQYGAVRSFDRPAMLANSGYRVSVSSIR